MLELRESATEKPVEGTSADDGRITRGERAFLWQVLQASESSVEKLLHALAGDAEGPGFFNVTPGLS